MSSPQLYSPSGRPLDQLKVAELREELKKRGLSPKGVKKDLCERLEESIKKESQDLIEVSNNVYLHDNIDKSAQQEALTAPQHKENEESPEDEEETIDCQEKGIKNELKGDTLDDKEGNSDVDGGQLLVKEGLPPLDKAIDERIDIVKENLPFPMKEDLPLVDNAISDSVDIGYVSVESRNIACDVGMVDIVEENASIGDASVSRNDIVSENEGIISNTLSTHVVNVSVSLLQESVQAERIDGDVNMEGLDGSVSTNDGGSLVLEYDSTKENNVNTPVSDNTMGMIDGGILLPENNSTKNENDVENDVNVPGSQSSVVVNDGGFSVLEHISIGQDHDSQGIETLETINMEDIQSKVEHREVIQDITIESLENESMRPSSDAGVIADEGTLQEDIKIESLENESIRLSSDAGVIADEETMQEDNIEKNVDHKKSVQVIQDIKIESLENESIRPLSDGGMIADVETMQEDNIEKNVDHNKSVQVNSETMPCVIKDEETKELKIDATCEPELINVENLPTEKIFDASKDQVDYRADLSQQGKSDVFDGPKVHHEYTQDIIRTESGSGRISEEEERKEILSKSSVDETESRSIQKRKDEGADLKQPEPAKRVRRWSSSNNVQVEITKPLTMDTVKEITSPDIIEGSPVGMSKSSSKILATTGIKQNSSVGVSKPSPKIAAATKMNTAIPKSEPEANGAKRVVPAPGRPPTTSLKIERFVRPFTLNALKDMLAEFGTRVDFWMDQIKTHCYITYSSVDEASAARNGLYNKKWPPSFGNLLVAEFVDPNEVKARSEGILEKTVNAPPPHNKSSLSTPSHGQLNALPPPPPLRERLTQVQAHKEPEPQVLTLDDLFRKTKAKPHIYYLPLTDEQVSQKLGVKHKERELMRKPSARA